MILQHFDQFFEFTLEFHHTVFLDAKFTDQLIFLLFEWFNSEILLFYVLLPFFVLIQDIFIHFSEFFYVLTLLLPVFFQCIESVLKFL